MSKHVKYVASVLSNAVASVLSNAVASVLRKDVSIVLRKDVSIVLLYMQGKPCACARLTRALHAGVSVAYWLRACNATINRI